MESIVLFRWPSTRCRSFSTEARNEGTLMHGLQRRLRPIGSSVSRACVAHLVGEGLMSTEFYDSLRSEAATSSLSAAPRRRLGMDQGDQLSFTSWSSPLELTSWLEEVGRSQRYARGSGPTSSCSVPVWRLILWSSRQADGQMVHRCQWMSELS